ncbi:transposase [Streptomyces sp. INA 01156]
MTAQIARASNPSGTTAMWVRDRLDGLWCAEDFTAWYPRYGRPGLSPAQLATVCVLQFLLGLSDRRAAEAVRCRIDFTYAMALELDDPGFHHSVRPTSATVSPRVTAPTASSISRRPGSRGRAGA